MFILIVQKITVQIKQMTPFVTERGQSIVLQQGIREIYGRGKNVRWKL